METNLINNDNTSCIYRNTEPNVATFHDDERITQAVTEFPAGTILVCMRKHTCHICDKTLLKVKAVVHTVS